MNGQELNEDSPVKFLREACEFFGVSQSGSKRKLFERLCNYIEMQYKRDAVVVSENLRKKMLVPELSVQKAPDSLPAEEEQARHAVTHLPFQSWCSICVKAKSREDKSSQSTDFDKEDTGIPSIQMDWRFLAKIVRLCACWIPGQGFAMSSQRLRRELTGKRLKQQFDFHWTWDTCEM